MVRLRYAALVFRKDWVEFRRNRQVLVPSIIVPIIFAVILPIVALLPALSISTQAPSIGLIGVLTSYPESVKAEIAAMTGQQAIIYLISLYLFAPIFLIIPIMASSVIASDSFAGEKERRTIEALLATPLSESEMLLGKMLVAFIPAVIVTVASFFTYSAILDYLTVGIFNGRLILPNAIWSLMIFGLSPALAFADIGLTVLISTRAKGVREAQQISAILLVPIIAAVLEQTSGASALDWNLLATLTGLLVAADFIIFMASIKIFGRDKILMQLV